MALDQNAKYPVGTAVASAAYPEGSAVNSTAPGALDGYPLDKDQLNDRFGLEQALLKVTGQPASGLPDTALISQYLQGIIELAQGRAINYDDSGAADAYVLDVQANQQAPASLFDGQIFEFIAGNTNTGASTVNPAGLGAKNIVGTSAAGAIVAGERIKIRYRSGTTDFELEAGLIVGSVVQEVISVDPAVSTGTTTIPNDDTIPQNTEGDEYMTVTITPTSATNKLIIEFNGLFTHSATGRTMICALFQDAIVNALSVTRNVKGNISGAGGMNILQFEMPAGAVVAITFKIRVGSSVAGTTTFNGSGGSRLYGGVSNSFLKVTEVKV